MFNFFKRKRKKEMLEFFQSDEFKQIIGDVCLSASAQALNREIKVQDGKSNPGQVEIKTINMNILDFIAQYLPDIEARLTGCQAASEQSRNRAFEIRGMLGQIANNINMDLLPEAEQVKEINHDDVDDSSELDNTQRDGQSSE